MARQTDNLQLTLYAATDNPLVKDWRESLNLDNENSALSKIDVFAGDINTRVQTLENRPDAVRVNATSDDGINYTATVSNFSNPQDGATIRLSVDLENAGSALLSINGVGSGLTKPTDNDMTSNIDAGDLLPNRIYTLIYYDTDWILLGSMFPSEYSKSDHHHDMDYAPLMHNHDAEYSAIDHTHDGYADKDHMHDNYVTTNTNQSITGVKQFETYPTLPTTAPSSTNPISLSYANGAYLGIGDKASDSNRLNGQLASYYVNTSASQTIGGVKTFSSLPVLPTSTPTTDNAIRKGYADSTYVGMAGNQTVGGEKTFSALPKVPTTTPTSNDQVASKAYVDSVAGGGSGWHFLTSPLTSTAWDYDAFSTTAKTKIDLSAVFGVPAGVKGILVRLAARDSGSESGYCQCSLSPNAIHDSVAIQAYLQGVPNDVYVSVNGVVPCDENGDVYYQIVASGTGTLDAILEIWGYWL